ncbi:MAG: anthranilate/aminodeoxychorismate synthase component II, partial [Pseudomonadota bacterium]|nr:anthranilate/aminodeoxychorismate synthase component II [Pseudomonadota bacterium]
DDQEIMAIHHRELPIWGIQFHPESILTEAGMAILKNFLVL